MTREQLEHLLRAASRIAEDPDVIVVGSQAILGSFDETQLPDEAIGSIEADVCFVDDPDNEKSDRIDGAIGELSSFHDQFGVYAQGVNITTAVLAPGWQERVVVLDTPGVRHLAGDCASSATTSWPPSWPPGARRTSSSPQPFYGIVSSTPRSSPGGSRGCRSATTNATG